MLPRDDSNDLRVGLEGDHDAGPNDSDYIGYSLILAVAGAGLVLAIIFSVF